MHYFSMNYFRCIPTTRTAPPAVTALDTRAIETRLSSPHGEIVHLWELTIMMPHLDKDTKLQMKLKFEFWNQQVIEAARKGM